MAEAEKKDTPAPYVPPSQIDPSELMKAFVEDGVIEAPKPEAGKSATPPVADSPPAPQKDSEVPALVRIAKERDAFRKEQESVKPHLEVLKAFSPQELQRIAAARSSGDPQAALAALGFTHSQYTAKLLGEKPEETAVPEKTTESPEVKTLAQELQALKAEREAEKFTVARQQAFGKIEGMLKDNPKFTHINTFKDFEGIEGVLTQHWQEQLAKTGVGSLPADTFEENVMLAAELLESRYKGGEIKLTKKQWEQLTPGTVSAQVPSKAPDAPRTGTESPRTLTNAMSTAPAAARTAPKSRDELLERIAKGDDLSGFDP